MPAALLAAGLVLGTRAEAQTTERVSIASDGSEGNGLSFYSAISADGRFVAFDSSAENLVPGDTNAREDIFVHDRNTGVTERVSVTSGGGEGFSGAFKPALSSDGRYVAFDSSGLATVCAGGFSSHIFVHDRTTHETECVSVTSDGNGEDGFSDNAAISAGGRFVAFSSSSSNLVEGDTNRLQDVFVHDRVTGITERVSVASDGTEGNGVCFQTDISADGRFVAFDSRANNLVTADTNEEYDIFVHDRVTGTTERVSVASDGTQGNDESFDPAISADGRFVAFSSNASNLVADDSNGTGDVFVHDRVTGVTERVSITSDSWQGNGGSYIADISSDGRIVVFRSDATNFVADDTNALQDIFVHDRVTGNTERVNIASDGAQANGKSRQPAISPGGRYVAFSSGASNLVAGDTNDTGDIFVHDRGAPPQLVVAGACPGSVSLSLTGATPEGQVAFGWGSGEGAFTLPPGLCAGAEIDLADPHPLIVLTADPSGAISRNETVGAGACGRLLQALDITTCGASNVAGLP